MRLLNMETVLAQVVAIIVLRITLATFSFLFSRLLCVFLTILNLVFCLLASANFNGKVNHCGDFEQWLYFLLLSCN